MLISFKLSIPLSNHWYAARFIIVSTSVWLFVRSLFVFVNSFFHGSSHSSKAGRLGVSAERSPSNRLFSIKAMRWPVSCLEIITSFFCGENFLRVIYQFWIYLTEFFYQCAHVYLLISGYFQLTSRLLASREEPFWRKHGEYTQKRLGIINFWLYVFLALQFKFGSLTPKCHRRNLISNPWANQRAEPLESCIMIYFAQPWA